MAEEVLVDYENGDDESQRFSEKYEEKDTNGNFEHRAPSRPENSNTNGNMEKSVLFLANFTESTTREDVRDFFSPFGAVGNINITGKICFVDFERSEDASKAKYALHRGPGLGSESLIVDFKKQNGSSNNRNRDGGRNERYDRNDRNNFDRREPPSSRDNGNYRQHNSSDYDYHNQATRSNRFEDSNFRGRSPQQSRGRDMRDDIRNDFRQNDFRRDRSRSRDRNGPPQFQSYQNYNNNYDNRDSRDSRDNKPYPPQSQYSSQPSYSQGPPRDVRERRPSFDNNGYPPSSHNGYPPRRNEPPLRDERSFGAPIRENFRENFRGPPNQYNNSQGRPNNNSNSRDDRRYP